MTIQDLARIPSREVAEVLIGRLGCWFGGRWSVAEYEEGESFLLRAEGLDTLTREKARFYVIGFLAGARSGVKVEA